MTGPARSLRPDAPATAEAPGPARRDLQAGHPDPGTREAGTRP